MQNLNYWKQFESTGKIEDYLKYCAGDVTKQHREKNTTAPERERVEQVGVNPYAGIHQCNRNSVKTDAYR